MDTLDGVRLTRIGPKEFLKGKWLGSLQTRWFMLVCGIVAVVWVNLVERPNTLSFLPAALSWLVCVEILGLLAFAISSFCSKTMMAVALSFGVPIVLLTSKIFLNIWPRAPRFTAEYWLWVLFGMHHFSNANPWDSWELQIFKLVAWLLGGALLWAIALLGIHRKWVWE